MQKEVICPKCKENILIKIDEYRMINMYNFKNNHNIENKSIKEFDKLQKNLNINIIFVSFYHLL